MHWLGYWIAHTGLAFNFLLLCSAVHSTQIYNNLFVTIESERLGIGGLGSQFAIIYRRVFSSRLYPPELLKQLGVKHVKGK
jgi:hypothetical protein